MSLTIFAIWTIFVALLLYHVFWALCFSPLAQITGPKSFALTSWRLAKEDYRGPRTRTINHFHKEYDSAVEISSQFEFLYDGLFPFDEVH
jgi:hypothetical protein